MKPQPSASARVCKFRKRSVLVHHRDHAIEPDAKVITSTFDEAKKRTLAVNNSTFLTTVLHGGRRPCFAAILAAISSAILQ
jgi:hypothetical protein